MQKIDFILYLISLVFGGAGAWIISSYGYQFGLLDNPNERSSHQRPTPKGGGIGILAAFVVSSLLLNIPPSFWFPITAIALFSFCGDKHDFSPKIRLPMHFIAAIALLAGTSEFHLPQISGLLLITALAAFIVGTANFYNFMDGINGIAAITGIVGFGLLALYSFLSESYSSFAVLSMCIYFSCLGFLPFNIPKARVFMGDVGSILLGFSFAGMVVWLSKGLLDFICLAAFLFPFYADELTTMVVRIRDGENILRAHRRHLYQLLANEKGVSQWKVSLGYGILQLAVGVSILLFKDMGSIAIISMLAIYFGAFAGMGFAVRRKLE